jgi:hypothetical protein
MSLLSPDYSDAATFASGRTDPGKYRNKHKDHPLEHFDDRIRNTGRRGNDNLGHCENGIVDSDKFNQSISSDIKRYSGANQQQASGRQHQNERRSG